MKNKTFVIIVKNYTEAVAIKVFCFCPVLFDIFTLIVIFSPGLSV